MAYNNPGLRDDLYGEDTRAGVSNPVGNAYGRSEHDLLDEFSYGGSRAAARREADRSGFKAQEWDYKGGAFSDYDFSRADRARAMGQQARGEQQYGQDASLRVARGEGPSYAGARFTGDLEAAALAQAGGMAQGTSFAGRPTGGGALAAQRSGAQNMTTAGGQYGAGVASETAAGRSAFQSGAGSMREADIGQMGMDAARQQALNDDFYRRRAIADRMAAMYRAQQQGVYQAQMGGAESARGIYGDFSSLQSNAALEGRKAAAQRDAAAISGVGSMLAGIPIIGQIGKGIADAVAEDKKGKP